ncbi:MAG TPA: hypothetical protein VGK00_09960 [Anaerolineales bacterium]|jgi:hypothetical protein
MYVLITLSLPVLAIAIMVALRFFQRPASYSWLTGTLGALLTWVSILLWQFDLPRRVVPSLWEPAGLFAASPEFLAEPYAWLYALSLAALAAAVLLTFPARAFGAVNPSIWTASLALSLLGILAVLADNPLTLVLVWTAIDLVEFLNTLRTADSPSISERTVLAFSIRATGTGLALWASVFNATSGQAFLFENSSGQASIMLLLAVGLRLGVLPLHLTYRTEPASRRGFGTIMRFVSAATSLVLLSRLPASGLDPVLVPYLLILVSIAGLYSGWMWLSAPDELSGRPYWIIGMSSLSLAAALRGNPTGSAAWGVALVLFGGISFLYSARHTWYTRLLAGLGVLLMALPFSLTASGWSGNFPWPVLFWPLFISAHFMLVAGYVRHLFRTGKASFGELPTWAQSAYPVGLALLGLTAILASVWGWPGALQTGAWLAAIASAVLGGLAGFAAWRFGWFIPENLSTPRVPGSSRLADLLDLLARVFWALYRFVRQFFDVASNLLEGDGGVLWTLLLLVLFIIILRSG